jgi:hypothetical protein
MALNLLQNLNSTGSIRATNARAKTKPLEDEELKSDGMLLQTVILTFIKAGAATALIKSMAAMFKTSRDKELKVIVESKGKKVSVSGRDLGAEDFASLVRLLESEVRHG